MHPMRSALTSLGIVAGVASVVMVSSIAEGTKQAIQTSIDALGANRIDVNSGTKDGARNATLPFGGLYMLVDKDVSKIKNSVRGLTSVSGFLRGNADVTFGRTKAPAFWTGGNADAAQVLGYEMSSGRGLSLSEGNSARRVAVVGQGIAHNLLLSERAIGSRIRLGGTSFTVIGIFKHRGLSMLGQDLDDVVVVPIEAARRHLLGDFPLPHGGLQQIGIRLIDMNESQRSARTIEQLLRSSHKLGPGSISDFYITSITETVEAKSKADRSMSLLLISVATICLVVGGVGVMNIMLVSISERVGEIGLRMALGASPNNIRRQFLMESMLLSVVGGIVGGMLGVAGSYLVSKSEGIATQVNLLVLLTAVIVTMLTGITFGMWPANQAARMHPVDALRRL